MGFRDFLTIRKRRILSGIQIPMHTEALLSQIKGTVAITRHLPFDPPHQIETFFQMIDMYPLLCGLLSELQPRNATLFWDTYGEWLLHKVHHPVPSLGSPRIGPTAHRADVKALKFATHHLWPASFWRDKHCYRCFIKDLGARPLRLASNQCDRHACQSWVHRLLDNLHVQHPGFSPRNLLQRRDSKSTRRRRSSSKSPSRKNVMESSTSNRRTGRAEQHPVKMVTPLNNEQDDGDSKQNELMNTRQSTRGKPNPRGSGREMKGNTQKGNSLPQFRYKEHVEHETPVIMLTDL